jgi:hypothetical protein
LKKRSKLRSYGENYLDWRSNLRPAFLIILNLNHGGTKNTKAHKGQTNPCPLIVEPFGASPSCPYVFVAAPGGLW